MKNEFDKFEEYSRHLKAIRWSGRIYKRFFSAPMLYLRARRFGPRILEVGSGIGSGVLGRYPDQVAGIDINPAAVEFSKNQGLNAKLINQDGSFPILDGSFDVCILDNVLEHIEDSKYTLDECWRVTSKKGGMVIAVPGVSGFKSDFDHKLYYDQKKLYSLDNRFILISLFSIPFYFTSSFFSRLMRQYCLVAIYKKNHQVFIDR